MQGNHTAEFAKLFDDAASQRAAVMNAKTGTVSLIDVASATVARRR